LRHTEDRQSINLPSIQGDGAQSQLPILFCEDSYCQSSYVSVQQSEFTPYTSPISSCQRREAPILQGLAFKVPKYTSKTQSAKRSKRGGTSPKEWPCPQDGCNKKYERPSYLTRHIRDKHKTRHKCLFCTFRWTRADVIKKHIRTTHQGLFTEEEHREIQRLRGWDGTIRSLAKYGMPKLTSNNATGAWAPRSPGTVL
jgi:hypothetical protein